MRHGDLALVQIDKLPKGLKKSTKDFCSSFFSFEIEENVTYPYINKQVVNIIKRLIVDTKPIKLAT